MSFTGKNMKLSASSVHADVLSSSCETQLCLQQCCCCHTLVNDLPIVDFVLLQQQFLSAPEGQGSQVCNTTSLTIQGMSILALLSTVCSSTVTAGISRSNMHSCNNSCTEVRGSVANTF
jgi:hypothetical protein